METTQVFKGKTVFVCRNLLPHGLFDEVQNALKFGGAEVFLCSDPSRNGPSDFHVIASQDHEKFAELKARGCNLLGPKCVLSCAKDGRLLPQGGFTCCLAMYGQKVLASASDFEIDEQAKIKEMVTSMGGMFSAEPEDPNFIIAKNVLSAMYKCYSENKPVVALDWLDQCWREHCMVSTEPYKIPNFSGLIITLTGIPADQRKKMEKMISHYGGKYSPKLTKRSTHLIAHAAEGDKYKVARKWGRILIVTPEWFQQSIERKVYVREEDYPVPASLRRGVGYNGEENFHEWLSGFDDSTARDSESEDSDLYLSDCRILLLGFEDLEMHRLAGLVSKGGGSRHMILNDRMTHIVVGTPTECEKRSARSVSAFVNIHVVRPIWLEDCDREKKNLAINQAYIADNLIHGSLPVLGGSKSTTHQGITYDSSIRSIKKKEVFNYLGRHSEDREKTQSFASKNRLEEVVREQPSPSTKAKQMLEQTSEIQGQKTPGGRGSEKTALFPTSEQCWTSKFGQSSDQMGMYDGSKFLGVPVPKYQGGCTRFYDCIFELLDDPSSDSIISWGKSNRSFVIWDQNEFVRRKMLRRFFCSTFTEFVSKLKFHGLNEIGRSGGQWEFGNKNFVRGKPDFATKMYFEMVLKRMNETRRIIQAQEMKARAKDALQDLTI